MPTLRQTALPADQSLMSLQRLGRGPLAPAKPSVVGGLIAAYNTLFAAAQPPLSMDTDIELLLAQSDDNPFFAGGMNSAFSFLQERLAIAQERRNIYREYDEMQDDFPEVNSAMDIYADNVVATDAYTTDIVSILTEDEQVGALFLVVKQLLKIDRGMRTRAREIALGGEHFDEIVYDTSGFLSRWKPLPTPSMIRNTTEFGVLPQEEAFSQVNDANQDVLNFADWQVVHYRLLRRPDDDYGTGLLYPIRRLSKRLRLAEDALLITRLTRAHKKLVFEIPVDNMAPAERRKYINDVKREYRKRRVVNPRTQRLDLENNPLAAEDDIFLGSTKDNKVEVKEIAADPSVGTINDIEFWQNKLFSALMVPKAYLGLERDINAKATLTEQDVQFSRTVHRVQMALQEGLQDLFDRALILAGFNPDEVEYTLAFPAISLIDELRNWEIESLKIQIAAEYKDLIRPSDRWILINLLGFSTTEADSIIADQDPLPETIPSGEGGGGGGAEDGEGDEEEGIGAASFDANGKPNRNGLERLFLRSKQLQIIGQRDSRRQEAARQSRDREQLAEEMIKYRTLANGRRKRRAIAV